MSSFCEAKREEMMEKNADAADFDISRALSKAWQELSNEDRKPYFDEAERERLMHQQARYESRMATSAMAQRQRAVVERERPGREDISADAEPGVNAESVSEAVDAPDAMAVEDDYQSQPERDESPTRPSGGFTAVNTFSRPNFL